MLHDLSNDLTNRLYGLDITSSVFAYSFSKSFKEILRFFKLSLLASES
jgi:hypothetical protein